ncbi:MAG: type IV pilus secretin PilQ [Deltaproteobacteria bacterium]|nr:MAG: type IV pilus secretin PilQ [Deltaproteobacteria bacterium]
MATMKTDFHSGILRSAAMRRPLAVRPARAGTAETKLSELSIPLESVMSAKPLLTILALALTASLAVATSAQAQGATNRLSSVEIDEAPDATHIRIVGSTQPTYSAYQLRNPSRIFIDFSGAEAAGSLASVDVGNGVVGRVSVDARPDGRANAVRVMIALDQDALYDVEVQGRSLVVQVDGAGRRAPGTASAQDLEEQLAAALERAQALEEAARAADARGDSREADILREQASSERAARERLESDLRQARSELTASEARSAELAARSDDLEQRLARAEAERDAAARRAASAQADAEAARSEARAAQTRSAQAEAEAAQLREREAALQASLAQVEALQAREAQLEARVAELAANGEEMDRSSSEELDALRSELAAAQGEIAEREQELDALRAQRRQVAPVEAAAPREDARPEPESRQPLRIRDVRFEQEGEVSRVIIEVSERARYTAEAWDSERMAVVFEGVSLAEHLRRRVDTSALAGPVESIASFVDEDGRTVVVAETRGAAAELLRRDGDRLVWEFTAMDGVEGIAAGRPSPAEHEHLTVSQRRPQMQPAQSGPVPGDPRVRRPRMAQKRISIDLRNADIENVLRLLADEGNVNIVAGSDVRGSITLRLRSVPLDEAFTLILRSQNLGWEQEGSIIRVAPMSVFEAEHERQLQRMAETFEVEPLAVRMVPISYANASQVQGLVRPMLSSRGSVALDNRTNTLIVTDIRNNLDTVESLARQLDTQTPQILIEARIVETNDSFRRQLGIQWGGAFVADQAIGNATGLRFPSSIGVAGGSTDGQTPTAGTASNPNFAVNLPAPAGTGEGGAIGLTLGSLGGALNLNLRLSAAELQGTAKIVSAPRITTLDNESATISSGVSIPVRTVSAAGANTVFFDAQVQLTVTPRVTPDGFIYMDVNVNKSEPDFERTGAGGDPSIIRRQASTQLLVRDGDTTVIGGIFQRNTGTSTASVPFFGNLPILGPLFRNSSQTDVRNELLVFITPRVVNRDLSIDRIGRGEEITPPRED